MNFTAASPPAAISWGEDRLDYFAVGPNHAVFHKYWDGHQWNPDDESEHENLGGVMQKDSNLAVSSWGKNRLDIVGKSVDGSFWHKYWSGSGWEPNTEEWENFGGNFSSSPAIVSNGENRLDVFGIGIDGFLRHKTWDGNQWSPSPTEWYLLPGNYGGNPVASSWGPGKTFVWAVSNVSVDGDYPLNYFSIDNGYLSGPFNLGGDFDSAPAISHWSDNRIDIVAQFAGPKADSAYYYKYWDGSSWKPSANDWIYHGGHFLTLPAIATWADNNLHFLGIGKDGGLKWQFWEGSQWLPSDNEYYDLGIPTGKPDKKRKDKDDDSMLVQDGHGQKFKFTVDLEL
jgi:hypothetical protein